METSTKTENSESKTSSPPKRSMNPHVMSSPTKKCKHSPGFDDEVIDLLDRNLANTLSTSIALAPYTDLTALPTVIEIDMDNLSTEPRVSTNEHPEDCSVRVDSTSTKNLSSKSSETLLSSPRSTICGSPFDNDLETCRSSSSAYIDLTKMDEEKDKTNSSMSISDVQLQYSPFTIINDEWNSSALAANKHNKSLFDIIEDVSSTTLDSLSFFTLPDIAQDLIAYHLTASSDDIHPFYRCGMHYAYIHSTSNEINELSDRSMSLLLVNKSFTDLLLKTYYSTNTFAFEDAHACKWFLQTIGSSNLSHIRNLKFVIRSGWNVCCRESLASIRLDGDVYEVSHEEKWYQVLCWLQHRHRLEYLAIQFRHWYPLDPYHARYTNREWEELHPWREKIVSKLCDFRGLKKVYLEQVEGRWLSERDRREIMLAMIQPATAIEEKQRDDKRKTPLAEVLEVFRDNERRKQFKLAEEAEQKERMRWFEEQQQRGNKGGYENTPKRKRRPWLPGRSTHEVGLNGNKTIRSYIRFSE